MEDDLGPAHRVVDALVGAELALDHGGVEAGQVRTAPRGEVVEHAHLVAALEQRAHEVRADEPTAAGDERDAAHADFSATTWKFANSVPGPGSLRVAERASIASAAELSTATRGLARAPTWARRAARSM